MVSADDLTAMFTGFGEGAVANIISWVYIGFVALIVATVFLMIYIYMTYNVKVQWRWVEGDPKTPGKHWLGKQFKDRGKRIKDKGVPKFKMFMAGKKLPEIPQEFVYPDGVYLLRIDKDTFVPTARPRVQGGFEGTPEDILVTLKPIESDLKFWSTLELQDMQQRFTPEDLSKRMIWATVIAVGIIVVFVAFAMYMTQQYHLKSLAQVEEVAGPLKAIMENLASGSTGPG